MIGTFLTEAPAVTKITASDAMTKLWNAIITAFTKMWEIIAVNMPQIGNFFADYWIFIFPFILAIFFICFKMFEKLPGAGLLTKKSEVQDEILQMNNRKK